MEGEIDIICVPQPNFSQIWYVLEAAEPQLGGRASVQTPLGTPPARLSQVFAHSSRMFTDANKNVCTTNIYEHVYGKLTCLRIKYEYVCGNTVCLRTQGQNLCATCKCLRTKGRIFAHPRSLRKICILVYKSTENFYGILREYMGNTC